MHPGLARTTTLTGFASVGCWLASSSSTSVLPAIAFSTSLAVMVVAPLVKGRGGRPRLLGWLRLRGRSRRGRGFRRLPRCFLAGLKESLFNERTVGRSYQPEALQLFPGTLTRLAEM